MRERIPSLSSSQPGTNEPAHGPGHKSESGQKHHEPPRLANRWSSWSGVQSMAMCLWRISPARRVAQSLYRQAAIYAQQGVKPDRTTMARGVGACEALHRYVMMPGKVQGDDTALPVLALGKVILRIFSMSFRFDSAGYIR